MTQKWELLKDLPGAKAGSTYTSGGPYVTFGISTYEAGLYPEFFRRVPNRWEPMRNEEYWSLTSLFRAAKKLHMAWQMENSLMMFRTEDQATEAGKRIKAVLEQYHEEIGE